MKHVRLSDIAEQIRGVTYGKDDAFTSKTEGTIPILRANNIIDSGINFSDLIYVASDNVSERQLLRYGDIVIAASSGSISVVGKAAQLDKDFFGSFGAFCKVVRPFKDVWPRFLGHFFRTPIYRQRMSTLAAGANINNLKNEHIDSLEIPLPALPEQKRIAAILDQADNLRRLRQRAIDRLSALGQAIFFEMFGDRWTTKNWESMPLTEFFEFRTGKLDSNASVKGGKYPFFTCSKENYWIDNFAFDCEALLLAGNNATADYSLKRYRGKFNAYQRTYVLTLKDSNYSYAYAEAALQQKLNELKRASIGSNTKYLTMGIFRQLRILVPPLDIQHRFERRLIELDRQAKLYKCAWLQSNSLFLSLQSLAFRGEL